MVRLWLINKGKLFNKKTGGSELAALKYAQRTDVAGASIPCRKACDKVDAKLLGRGSQSFDSLTVPLLRDIAQNVAPPIASYGQVRHNKQIGTCKCGHPHIVSDPIKVFHRIDRWGIYRCPARGGALPCRSDGTL